MTTPTALTPDDLALRLLTALGALGHVDVGTGTRATEVLKEFTGPDGARWALRVTSLTCPPCGGSGHITAAGHVVCSPCSQPTGRCLCD